MRRWRPGAIGLRGRIAWGVFAAVLVSSTVTSALAYVHLSHSAEQQFRQQAQRQAESDLFGAASSADTATSNGGGPETADLDSAFEATLQRFFIPDKTYAVVVLKPVRDGAYSFTRSGPGDSNTLHTTAPPTLVAATPFPAFVTEPSSEDFTVREIRLDGHWLAIGGTTALGSRPGYFRAPVVAVDYLDMRPLDTEITRYRSSFLAVIATAALIAAAFAWVLAGVIQRPVRRAAVAAREFGAGDRDVRLPVRGHDAVADLAAGFNTMADELTATVTDLERSDARQRRFVADVSHELRTPMTALVAAAAALDDPTTRDRAAVLVAPQLRRLSQLTTDLVETSAMDDGTAVVTREPIDLLALARDVAEHSEAPGQVTVSGGGDVHADIDPRRIHTVVRNLVANAQRHGAPPVEIDVRGEADSVRVTVSDAGPGLPADLGDAVFDRFVRGDAARSGPGTGLGLSLARDNAELGGGTLTAADRDEGGARFTLTLPRRAGTATPAAVATPRAVAPADARAPVPSATRRSRRSWVLAAAVVGVLVVAGGVTAVVATTRPAPPRAISTLTPQQTAFRALFGPGVPTGPVTVLATNTGPEGTTVELVQAASTNGPCTTVRVSTPSADLSPQVSCGAAPDGALAAPTGQVGGSWSWVSSTTGVTWSGWYGLGATAPTVELRLDNQVVGSARPTAGAYVLPAVPDSRPGCRTVVALDASGAAAFVDYLQTACDPSRASTTPAPS